MRHFRIYRVIVMIVIFLLISLYVFAAGGGGGGSSSGLGFGSRDSIYILVNEYYSELFSLKNNTKYNLKVNVNDNKATVTFGGIKLELLDNDNYVDLNDNNLADINFNLVKIKGKRVDIRIINAKDKVIIIKEESNNIIETIPEEEILDEKKKKIEDDSEEDELKCGKLKTLRERVSCRLELEEEEQEEELELYYLPEECGALTGSQRGICIARYKSVQTCWKFPIGDERVSCAKRAIKLKTIQEEKGICNALTGDEKSKFLCVRQIKNKVYNIIKWRFYDLEERAEDFMHRDLVDEEPVSDLIVKLEQKKIEFNEATTKEERKNIILDVRNDWKEFVEIVKDNLRG